MNVGELRRVLEGIPDEIEVRLDGFVLGSAQLVNWHYGMGRPLNLDPRSDDYFRNTAPAVYLSEDQNVNLINNRQAQELIEEAFQASNHNARYSRTDNEYQYYEIWQRFKAQYRPPSTPTPAPRPTVSIESDSSSSGPMYRYVPTSIHTSVRATPNIFNEDDEDEDEDHDRDDDEFDEDEDELENMNNESPDVVSAEEEELAQSLGLSETPVPLEMRTTAQLIADVRAEENANPIPTVQEIIHSLREGGHYETLSAATTQEVNTNPATRTAQNMERVIEMLAPTEVAPSFFNPTDIQRARLRNLSIPTGVRPTEVVDETPPIPSRTGAGVWINATVRREGLPESPPAETFDLDPVIPESNTQVIIDPITSLLATDNPPARRVVRRGPGGRFARR